MKELIYDFSQPYSEEHDLAKRFIHKDLCPLCGASLSQNSWDEDTYECGVFPYDPIKQPITHAFWFYQSVMNFGYYKPGNKPNTRRMYIFTFEGVYFREYVSGNIFNSNEFKISNLTSFDLFKIDSIVEQYDKEIGKLLLLI